MPVWYKGRFIIIFVVTQNEQILLAYKVARRQNPLFKGTEMNKIRSTKYIQNTLKYIKLLFVLFIAR